MIESPKNNNPLNEAFFPVDFRDLYWKDEKTGRNLFGEGPRFVRGERFRAVVALDREEMLSAVTDAYLLITNEEAHEWALEIAKEVFHVQNGITMECLTVKMPNSRASCEIDLVRNIERGQSEINNNWCAFIHIENSYNKTKTLTYEVGFYNFRYNRKLIYPEYTVQVSETHVKTPLDFHANILEKAHEKFAKIGNIEELFYEKIKALKRIIIAQHDMIPLFCKFNGMKVRTDLSEYQKDRMIKLYVYLNDIIDKCIKEFGPNAFCMLNVMTDYATNYDDPTVRLHSASRQLAVGKWVDDIVREKTKPNFSMHEYIGNEAGDAASWLQTLYLLSK